MTDSRNRWAKHLIILVCIQLCTVSLPGALFNKQASGLGQKTYTIAPEWPEAPFIEADSDSWFSLNPLPPEPWDALSLTIYLDNKLIERNASPDGFCLPGLAPGRHVVEVTLKLPRQQEYQYIYELFVIGTISVSILKPEADKPLRVGASGFDVLAALSWEAPGLPAEAASQVVRSIQWFLDDTPIAGPQQLKQHIPQVEPGSYSLRVEAETLFGGSAVHELEFTAMPDISLNITAKGNDATTFHDPFTMRAFEVLEFQAVVEQPHASKETRVFPGKTKKPETIINPNDICWYIDGKLQDRGALFLFEAEPGSYTLKAEYSVDGTPATLISSPVAHIEVQKPRPAAILSPSEPGYPYVEAYANSVQCNAPVLTVLGDGEPDAAFFWTLDTSEGNSLKAEGKAASFPISQLGDLEGATLTLTTEVDDWKDTKVLVFAAGGIPGMEVELILPQGAEVIAERAFGIITQLTHTAPATQEVGGPFRFSYMLDGILPLEGSSPMARTTGVIHTPGLHTVRVVVHDTQGNAALEEAEVWVSIPWELRLIPEGPCILQQDSILALSMDLQPANLAPQGSYWWELKTVESGSAPVLLAGKDVTYRFTQSGTAELTGWFRSVDGELELAESMQVTILEEQPPRVVLRNINGRNYSNPEELVRISASVYASTGTSLEASLVWFRNGSMQTEFQNRQAVIFTAGEAGSLEDIVCIATLPSGQSGSGTLQIPVNAPPEGFQISLNPQTSVIPARGSVEFSVEGAMDPEGNLPLTYQWFTVNNGRLQRLSPPLQTETWTGNLPVGSNSVFVLVTDSHQLSAESGRISVEVR